MPLLSGRRGEVDLLSVSLETAALERALQHAIAEMLDWLMRHCGLDEVAATHVMGRAWRYDIANVFNPAYSVVCRIGREWLAGIHLTEGMKGIMSGVPH